MRGVILWALLRVLVTAAMLFAATGSPSPMSSSPNPVAVIVLCTLLGSVDIRRRREGVLWANLGVSSAQLALLFTLVAAAGETLLAAFLP
jgi:hypothetical protein